MIAALHRLHLTPLESLFVPQASLYVPAILTVWVMWVNIYIHSAICAEGQIKKQSFLCLKCRRICYREAVALIRHSMLKYWRNFSLWPSCVHFLALTFFQHLTLSAILLCIKCYAWVDTNSFFLIFIYCISRSNSWRSPGFTHESSISFHILVLLGVPILVYSILLVICGIKGLEGQGGWWLLFQVSFACLGGGVVVFRAFFVWFLIWVWGFFSHILKCVFLSELNKPLKFEFQFSLSISHSFPIEK